MQLPISTIRLLRDLTLVQAKILSQVLWSHLQFVVRSLPCKYCWNTNPLWCNATYSQLHLFNQVNRTKEFQVGLGCSVFRQESSTELDLIRLLYTFWVYELHSKPNNLTLGVVFVVYLKESGHKLLSKYCISFCFSVWLAIDVVDSRLLLVVEQVHRLGFSTKISLKHLLEKSLNLAVLVELVEGVGLIFLSFALVVLERPTVVGRFKLLYWLFC